jgi:hypothetical protein
VAERLVRLAKLVGSENVMAGTDCGFAQGPFVQRVHPSIMWASCDRWWKGPGSPRSSFGRVFILALVGDRKSRRWMRGSGKALLHFGLSV